MITLITLYLARFSPSWRAARAALFNERARQIGVARRLARKSIERAAFIEHAEWMLWADAGCSDAEYFGTAGPTPGYDEASGEWRKMYGSDYATRGPGFLPAACWRVLPLFGRTFRGAR